MTAKQRIYYLSGQGGRLHKGLGEALLARGLDVVGREIQGEFKTIGFAAQVSTIVNDLQTQHWDEGALVIATTSINGLTIGKLWLRAKVASSICTPKNLIH